MAGLHIGQWVGGWNASNDISCRSMDTGYYGQGKYRESPQVFPSRWTRRRRASLLMCPKRLPSSISSPILLDQYRVPLNFDRGSASSMSVPLGLVRQPLPRPRIHTHPCRLNCTPPAATRRWKASSHLYISLRTCMRAKFQAAESVPIL